VIALTRVTTNARQTAALISIVTHQVLLPIRTCAFPTPDANRAVEYGFLEVVVWRTDPPTQGRAAFHFPESPMAVPMIAFAMGPPPFTGDAPAQVSLIAHVVNLAIGTGAPSTPDADGSTHYPVDNVVWHRKIGVVL